MKIFFGFIFFFIAYSSLAKSDEVSDWLKIEIDKILNAYDNLSISNVERFELIENAINNNFAGAPLAKFVAGKSWSTANKETKNEFVKLFRRHLALNIASMMQGYSSQQYKLVNSIYDKKTKSNLIDMEITSETSKLIVTWRVKESKDRFYVIDLLIADISLLKTKRSEFHSALKKVDNNLNNFINVLRKQNETSFSKIIN